MLMVDWFQETPPPQGIPESMDAQVPSIKCCCVGLGYGQVSIAVIKYLILITYRQERFNLAQDFRGFSPKLVGSIA